jgi:hypothetical protein
MTSTCPLTCAGQQQQGTMSPPTPTQQEVLLTAETGAEPPLFTYGCGGRSAATAFTAMFAMLRCSTSSIAHWCSAACSEDSYVSCSNSRPLLPPPSWHSLTKLVLLLPLLLLLLLLLPVCCCCGCLCAAAAAAACVLPVPVCPARLTLVRMCASLGRTSLSASPTRSSG